MNRSYEKILTATIQLLIGGGVRKWTMDEIARHANVSKVTIYKHFTDKDALFTAISRHLCSAAVNSLEAASRSDRTLSERFADTLEVLTAFTQSGHANLCEELSLQNVGARTEREQYLRIYRQILSHLIDEGITGGLFRDGLDREMVFCYVDMGVSYFQQNRDYRRLMQNDLDFQRRFFRFYVSGLFTDGDPLFSRS